MFIIFRETSIFLLELKLKSKNFIFEPSKFIHKSITKMFGRAFANQTTANKNFMVMERPSKSSPFTNPVVQESNANRQT